MQYEQYLQQIEIETQAAIKAGWEHAKIEWRRMALEKLLETCLTTQEFTVNDFRDKIKNTGITTHDNRAMGGLMTTGKKLKWIMLTGKEIPSIVGHRVPIQYWKSLIYQGPYVRMERLEAVRYSMKNGAFIVEGAHNKQYTVKEFSPGYWQCNCEGYRFSSKKTCKHIMAIVKDLEMRRTQENNNRQQPLL